MNKINWLHITDEDGDAIAVQVNHITHILKINDRVCSDERSKIVLVDGTFVILNKSTRYILEAIEETQQAAAESKVKSPNGQLILDQVRLYADLRVMAAKDRAHKYQVEEAWVEVCNAVGGLS